MNDVFNTLNVIDVNEHTEKKGDLTYLSWAWAWAEVKKAYPEAYYTIYENKDGLFYHHDGRTAWVKTGVTIEGLEHVEYLPVMDFKNKSVPLDNITSIAVNKAIQRSLTKACARHGLGLYIYAGEDLPEGKEEPAEISQELAKGIKEKGSVEEAREKGEARLKFLEEMKTKTDEYVNNVAGHYGLKKITEINIEQIEDYMKHMEEKKGE